jgi:hypothetical protein
MEVFRKYGVAASFLFPLIDAGAQDFESTPVTFVAADCQISKDGGAFANTGCIPWHVGNGVYAASLTSTEMQAARVALTVIDAATKAWEDQAIIIGTYGHASAQHAFDLDTATQNVNTSTVSASAITASAFDAGAVDAAAIGACAIGSAEIAATGANKIADHTIRRTFENACDSVDGDTKTGRSLLGGIGKLVNKITSSGGTLTIYEDDDTTSLFTQSVTTDSGADPITELDTV